MREAKGSQDLDYLVGVKELIAGRQENGCQARMDERRRLGAETRREVGLLAIFAVRARSPECQELCQVLQRRQGRTRAGVGDGAHAAQ
jgi:hypothetical protein